MLANIFMDLLYIVGIAFLGILFISIAMSAANEIRLERSKKKVLKTLENATLKAFKEELDKIQKNIQEDKGK